MSSASDPYAALPGELTALPRWVCWSWAERGGKRTKVPMQARRPGVEASSTNAATWSDFASAVGAAGTVPCYAGIGFVFAEGDDIAGVDLDGCFAADGALEPWAAEILALLAGTYCERSPSGHGLHLFVRAVLPPTGRRRGPVEMYEAGRYFTVTGNRYGDAPSIVAPLQAALEAVHERFLARAGDSGRDAATLRLASEAAPVRAVAPLTEDDAELARRMFASQAGARIAALVRGDLTAYDGDRSAADLALANHLVYWCDGDLARADRLFRASALYRAKWDERRGAATYGQLTLAAALDAWQRRAPLRRTVA